MTIKDLMETVGRRALIAKGSPYVMGDVKEIPDGEGMTVGYYVMLTDPKTKMSVPLTWSQKDDEQGDEHKVNIVTSLIDNGHDSLQFIIEQRGYGHGV